MKKDLTGQRFGRLVVVAPAPPISDPKTGRKLTCWHCKCDCGNELDVRLNCLGRSTFSCGCLQREKAAATAQNLIGKRYGRLTVIARDKLPKPEANGSVNGWRCRCDCGNEIVVPARFLTAIGKKSCGCLIAEKAAERISEDGENVFERYDSTMVSALKSNKPRDSNQTGVRGVSWNEKEQRYRVRLMLRGKEIYLGRYKTLEAAIDARREGEEKYYSPVIKEYEESKND